MKITLPTIAAAAVAAAAAAQAAPVPVVGAATHAAVEDAQPSVETGLKRPTDEQQDRTGRIDTRGINIIETLGKCLEGICGGSAKKLDKPDNVVDHGYEDLWLTDKPLTPFFDPETL